MGRDSNVYDIGRARRVRAVSGKATAKRGRDGLHISGGSYGAGPGGRGGRKRGSGKRCGGGGGNRKGWIIAAVMLAVLIVAAAAVLIYMNSKKPKETAQECLLRYMALLNEEDYASMYGMLDEESAAKISEEEFTERYRNIYGGIEASDITAGVLRTEDNGAVTLIEYNLSMETVAGRLEFPTAAIFRLDEDRFYRMSWDTQDIFPDLKAGDKVKVVSQNAARGEIFDRNGQLLAGEGVASSVGVVPGKLEDRDEAVARLSELLEMDAEKIEKALDAGWVKDDMFVPLRTVAKDDMEIKEKLLEIKGVMISDTKERFYPLGEAAAHLIGYVQNVTAEDLEKKAGLGYTADSVIGKAGLEKLYEDRLKGTNGQAIVIVDGDGNQKNVVLEKPVSDGENIQLTLDINQQRTMYEQIKEDKGLGVAMDPATGEILAMASAPSYNPNAFVVGLRTSQWNALNESVDQPMYNRVRGTWCPGSSFKPIIAAVGLTEGILDPEEIVDNDGLKWQKSDSWGDFFVTTLTDYSPKNLENALIHSDNIYFAKAADKIGGEILKKNLQALGFLEELPFELGLDRSSFGEEGNFTSEADVANSGYGQGKMVVNPVHLASMYSALYNSGDMIAPVLEKRAPSFWKEGVFSEDAAKMVLDDMIRIVEDPEGTGHDARTEGITIAGKTGTAELKLSKEDTQGQELGWFAAVCEKEGKRPLLALMMIEDVKGRGGSHYVTPKVRECIQNYYNAYENAVPASDGGAQPGDQDGGEKAQEAGTSAD